MITIINYASSAPIASRKKLEAVQMREDRLVSLSVSYNSSSTSPNGRIKGVSSFSQNKTILQDIKR